MTSRADFTDEEWARLGRAPLVAGLAISVADPSGPVGALKESSAAIKTVIAAAGDGGFGEFVRSLAGDVAARAKRRESPLSGFAPDRRRARDAILEELQAVNALVVAKAAPEDVADYRGWIRTAAQQAALAAREGGFLGIGGERVSEREQQMLDTLGEIFGAPRGTPAAPESAPAETAESPTETNRETIRRAFEAWQSGTAAITEAFAAEMVWRIEGRSLAAKEYASKQQFIDEALAPFGARFSSSEPFRPTTIRAVYADGDTVIVLWDGRGIATDGQPYENSYTWIMRLRDGLVVDGTAFFDSIAFDDLWTRVKPA